MSQGSVDRPPTGPGADRLPDGWARHLAVDTDMDVEVTTTGGSATGRLTSNGRLLRLQLDHPDVLASAGGRSAFTGVAAGLAQAGIGAEVHGPRGRIAYLDPARTSRVAAVVTGSPHVGLDPGAWRWAGTTALTRVRRAIPGEGLLAAVVLGAVVIVAAVRRRS